MAPAIRRKKRKDEIKVTIAPFRNLADFKTCEDIQREVWNSQDIDVCPGPDAVGRKSLGGHRSGSL
jgi:predicted GNAT superfamily acetyltransferase